MTAVLDASAVLAFVKGEPGAEVVAERPAAGARCSTANWSEIAQKILAAGRDWDLTRALLMSYDLDLEPVAVADAEWAAHRWKRGEGLSLADRLCLALAHRLEVGAWTADTHWGDDDGVHQIRCTRCGPSQERFKNRSTCRNARRSKGTRPGMPGCDQREATVPVPTSTRLTTRLTARPAALGPTRHIEVMPAVRTIDRRRLRHVDWVHVDVFGPAEVPVVRSLAEDGRHPVECHLIGPDLLRLIELVAPYASRCVLTGDSGLVRNGLARLQSLGIDRGVGIRSSEPTALALRFLDHVEAISFQADRTGDRLAPNTLGKVLAIRQALQDRATRRVLVGIDGVGPATAALAVAAGADLVVADPTLDLRAVRRSINEELALDELVRYGHRPVPTSPATLHESLPAIAAVAS